MEPDKVGPRDGDEGATGAAGPEPSAPEVPHMETKVKALLSAVKEVSHGAPVAANAGHLLTDLAQCLNAVLGLVQTTIANVRPTSEHTLPAVTSTLTAMIGATESVVNRVLDEADGFGTDHQRLLAALARLSPFVSASNMEGNTALVEARKAGAAMMARVTAITSAMEFQDLTAQHLNSAIKALNGTQGRLLEILASLKIPMETATLPPIRLEGRIASPAGGGTWRQTVVDQHFAERK
jgi:chemotaxis regulatin CheY-phosphate phosphatase CheZ